MNSDYNIHYLLIDLNYSGCNYHIVRYDSPQIGIIIDCDDKIVKIKCFKGNKFFIREFSGSGIRELSLEEFIEVIIDKSYDVNKK